MKKFTVRLSDSLMAQIEAESRERKLSKSDVIRERLSHPAGLRRGQRATLAAIADLVGSVDDCLQTSAPTRRDASVVVRIGGVQRSRSSSPHSV